MTREKQPSFSKVSEKKTRSIRQREPKITDLAPAPHNYLYTEHDPEEERLVTTLMLAAEALAEPLRPCLAEWRPEERPTFAKPVKANPALIDDFSGLLEITCQIQAWIEADPQRQELLTRLREAFGDGRLLRVLFRNLFLARPSQATLNLDGKPVLSAREVEVLREAAGDRSQEEIASRLDISPETVNTHFKHIYRKLGVQRPMQAVARAISMGHLDIDMLDWINAASECGAHGFGLFNSLLGGASDDSTLRPLAEFELLMLAMCSLTSHTRRNDSSYASEQGIVIQMSEQGEIFHSFGAGCFHHLTDIAVAPPHAARQGFTSGNLFVFDNTLQYGLNEGRIVECTPDGHFVRAFCGGPEIGTRISGAGSLAFAMDGRLLVSSGSLTDAILAFEDGGSSVQRFANGCFQTIRIDANGKVYASQYSSTGSIVKVFHSDGSLLHMAGGTPAGYNYYSISLNSQGHLFINVVDSNSSIIEEYNPLGELIRPLSVPGLIDGRLAIDAIDCLYVPCRSSADIKVLSPDGHLVRRFHLPDKIIPHCMAIGPNGHLWIGGRISQGGNNRRRG